MTIRTPLDSSYPAGPIRMRLRRREEDSCGVWAAAVPSTELITSRTTASTSALAYDLPAGPR